VTWWRSALSKIIDSVKALYTSAVTAISNLIHGNKKIVSGDIVLK